MGENYTIETTIEQYWNQADSERLWNERLKQADLGDRTGLASDEQWHEAIAAARSRRERADEALDRARFVGDKIADVQLDLLRQSDPEATSEDAVEALETLSEGNPLELSEIADASEAVTDRLEDLGASPLWEDVEAALVDSLSDTETVTVAVSLFEEAAATARLLRDEAAEQFRERIGEGYEGVGDPFTGLDEEPILLTPVHLETRFVDETTTFSGSLDVDNPELWIRVFPDQFHVDTHETALTDRERRWAENFWTTLWLAHVGHKDALDELPPRLERFASTVDIERYNPPGIAELKARAWDQLIDRFGEQRATYVIHAVSPTTGDGTRLGPELLSETPTDVLGDRRRVSRAGPRGRDVHLSGVTDPDPPVFPDTPRKTESWTKQPEERLLPDRWVAILEWEGEDGSHTKTVEGNPIPEPLRVGPDVEPREADADDIEDWHTDFKAAYKAGMAFRIDLTRLDDYEPSEGFERVIVLGVKLSLPATEGPEQLVRQLLDHRYSDGFSLVSSGTPTNVPDRTKTGAMADDPVGCQPPIVDVDNLSSTEDLTADDATADELSDGDILALALGVQSPETHPFGHVRGAANTEQLDQRHANTALWPATLGYTMINQWASGSLASGTAPEDTLRSELKKFDQYRRHFIRYVRPRGPFPTLRIEDQPYGLLPVRTPADGAVEDPSAEDETEVDFAVDDDRLQVDQQDIFFEGKDAVGHEAIDPNDDLEIDREVAEGEAGLDQTDQTAHETEKFEAADDVTTVDLEDDDDA